MNKNFIDEIKEEIVSSYLSKYNNLENNDFIVFLNNKAEDLSYVFLNRLYETTAFKDNYVHLFHLYNNLKLKNHNQVDLIKKDRQNVFNNNLNVLEEFELNKKYEPFLEISDRKTNSEKNFKTRVWTENKRSLINHLLADFGLKKPTIKKLYHLREVFLEGLKHNVNNKDIIKDGEFNLFVSLYDSYGEENTKFLTEHEQIRCKQIDNMFEKMRFNLCGSEILKDYDDIFSLNHLHYFFEKDGFKDLNLSQSQREEMTLILNAGLNHYQDYESYCQVHDRDKILNEDEFSVIHSALNEMVIDIGNPEFNEIKMIVEGLFALKEDIDDVFHFNLNGEEKEIYDDVENKLMSKYPFLNDLNYALDKDKIKTDVYALFKYKTKKMDNTEFHLLPVDYEREYIVNADFLLPILSKSASPYRVMDTIKYGNVSFDFAKPYIIENELHHDGHDFGIGIRRDGVQICLKDGYGVNVFHLSGSFTHKSELILDEEDADYDEYYENIDTQYHYKTFTAHHDKNILGADAFWLPYRNKHYHINDNNKPNRNQVLMDVETSSCHIDFKNMGLSKMAYEKLGQFAYDNSVILVRDLSSLSNYGHLYLKNHFKNLKEQHHNWLLLDIDKKDIADGEVTYSFEVFENKKGLIKSEDDVKNAGGLNHLLKEEFNKMSNDWIRINYNNVFYFHLREMILEKQLQEKPNDIIRLNTSQYNQLRKAYDKGLNDYRFEFINSMDKWIDEMKEIKINHKDNYFNEVQRNMIDKMENLMEKHERLLCVDIHDVSLEMLGLNEYQSKKIKLK